MKITNIIKKQKQKVFDISVQDTNSYILENGVISHNSGVSYACSTVIHMSKSKEEEQVSGKKTLVGSGARCTTKKNRFARERMQVRVVIDYNRGLSKYSGLFDLAVDSGFIISPSVGYYAYKTNPDASDDVSKEDWDNAGNPEGWSKKMRKKEFGDANTELWDTMVNNGLADSLYEKFSYQSSTDGVFDTTALEEDLHELEED